MAETFVLNRALILDRLGGDEEIFAMMVDMFLQDHEGNCAALAAAFAAGDAAVLQREAHTVKGLLATFSDSAGAQQALAVEQRAKAGDLNGLEQDVGNLQARLRLVADVLRG